MTAIKAKTIYIIGAGTIGLSLAAHLAKAGRQVILGRASDPDVLPGPVTVQVKDASQGDIRARVDAVSLAKLADIDGIVIVTAKAYANQVIADQLKAKNTRSAIVVMQNGIGVEEPFRQANFPNIYRCVLYSGGEKTGAYAANFKSIASSPIGSIEGDEETLHACVEQLSTPGFPFHAETGIQAEIWKKGITNAVFNAICPLLEIDNGIFFRDSHAADLAANIISECVVVAKALGIDLSEQALMDTVLAISRGTDGQLASTLLDIRNHRETEIAFLNLEIARVADSLSQSVDVGNTRLLGELVRIKASAVKRS